MYQEIKKQIAMKVVVIFCLICSFITCRQEDFNPPSTPNYVCDIANDYDNDGDCCTIGLQPINCSDTINCTNDYCINGVCHHDQINCDDGVAATIDVCEEQTGNCIYFFSKQKQAPQAPQEAPEQNTKLFDT